MPIVLITPVPLSISRQVSYGNLEVTLGNELKPVQVKNIPTKIDYPFSAGKRYTLAMVDPDAPSRQTPTYREWHHWLVVNIPENKVNEGQTLSEYVGSGPPPKTGLHRLVSNLDWLIDLPELAPSFANTEYRFSFAFPETDTST